MPEEELAKLERYNLQMKVNTTKFFSNLTREEEVGILKEALNSKAQEPIVELFHTLKIYNKYYSHLRFIVDNPTHAFKRKPACSKVQRM